MYETHSVGGLITMFSMKFQITEPIPLNIAMTLASIPTYGLQLNWIYHFLSNLALNRFQSAQKGIIIPDQLTFFIGMLLFLVFRSITIR